MMLLTQNTHTYTHTYTCSNPTQRNNRPTLFQVRGQSVSQISMTEFSEDFTFKAEERQGTESNRRGNPYSQPEQPNSLAFFPDRISDWFFMLTHHLLLWAEHRAI